MKLATKLFCATAAMILPVAAVSANELAPLQPGTFTLQEHTASIYYKEQSDSFQVVATIARNAGDGMPKRFVAELVPGQTATVAIGAFDPVTPPVVLELHHNGEGLNAQVLPDPPAATN
jgi:hypothetical protein